jgi:hypothetical protein
LKSFGKDSFLKIPSTNWVSIERNPPIKPESFYRQANQRSLRSVLLNKNSWARGALSARALRYFQMIVVGMLAGITAQKTNNRAWLKHQAADKALGEKAAEDLRASFLKSATGPPIAPTGCGC